MPLTRLSVVPTMPARGPARGKGGLCLLGGCGLLLFSGAGGAWAQAPAHPFPQHVPYAAGSIRPGNFTPAQVDADVAAFYDYWKATYVKTAGTTTDGRTMYRIAFGKSGTNAAATVSEGQGYGMVIVPLLAGHDPDARTIFDGLYEFAKAHPSVNEHRLMQWKIPLDAGDTGDSAFDGDADIAYGLMLANAQWGSTGPVNYTTAAKSWIAGILASTIGQTSRLPTLGDWVTPGSSKQYQPRSSDIMPGHFRAWGRFTADATWDTVSANCAAVVNAVQTNYSPTTGLLPDFIINANPLSSAKPAGANFLEGPNDGAYSYNAGRDPWRLGVDALLNGNAASAAQAKKIAAWMKTKSAGSAASIRAGYKLDGTNISGNNYFSSFFVAPVGVAAMLDSSNQAFLDSIYASVRADHEDYYEDSVTLQCLLVMSGNYWDPTTVGDQQRKTCLLALPPEGTIHVAMQNGVPAATFNVSPDAAGMALTLQRSTDLATWNNIAQRGSGAAHFQAILTGVTVQETPLSGLTGIRVNDGAGAIPAVRYYRLMVVP